MAVVEMLTGYLTINRMFKCIAYSNNIAKRNVLRHTDTPQLGNRVQRYRFDIPEYDKIVVILDMCFLN